MNGLCYVYIRGIKISAIDVIVVLDFLPRTPVNMDLDVLLTNSDGVCGSAHSSAAYDNSKIYVVSHVDTYLYGSFSYIYA